MKAMIFAAGLGTRLKPFTDTRPKALVEVGGEPMLSRVLRKIKDAGITNVVVNVHHFADMIKEYLSANNNFGMNIMISDETDRLLDTGGGLLAASDYLAGNESRNESIIVHNADILTDFSITKMLDAHTSSAADVTLLAQNRVCNRTFVYDESLKLKGWAKIDTAETIPCGLEISQFRNLAFGGVSVIQPSVFPYLVKYAREHGSVFSTTPFYASNCTRLNIRGYIPDCDYRWFDIGRPENLVKAEESFSNR